jgi:hypothetical protein
MGAAGRFLPSNAQATAGAMPKCFATGSNVLRCTRRPQLLDRAIRNVGRSAGVSAGALPRHLSLLNHQLTRVRSNA